MRTTTSNNANTSRVSSTEAHENSDLAEVNQYRAVRAVYVILSVAHVIGPVSPQPLPKKTIQTVNSLVDGDVNGPPLNIDRDGGHKDVGGDESAIIIMTMPLIIIKTMTTMMSRMMMTVTGEI